MFISTVVGGCSAAEQPREPESEASADPSGTDTWLRVVGAWPERVTLPAVGTTDCTRFSSNRGYSYREFHARTSDFADYDAGGERPGRDFDVAVYVPDADNALDETDEPLSPSLMIQFSDPRGQFFRLSGDGGDTTTITPSPDGTSVTFEATGSATSIDAEPLLVRAAGQIHCDTITEKP